MKTIYIFGNPLLPFDNLPIQLMPDLQKEFPEINFVHKDPNENLHPENSELIIIDTVVGPKEVVMINDIEKIESSPTVSMHDLDLGFNLKLLQKIGTLKNVTIFGVPMGIDKDEAFKKLKQILLKLDHGQEERL